MNPRIHNLLPFMHKVRASTFYPRECQCYWSVMIFNISSDLICFCFQAKYDANQSKKKAALIPLSQVTTTKHLHHPLQAPPFHPAYVFNHLDAARQGPYPRLQNGTSPVLHTSLQNGHIPQTTKNHHSVLHVSRTNGSIDA